MEKYYSFSEIDKQAFASNTKIGIIGTISEDGFPHLTIITTMLIKGDKQIAMGQFTEGISKTNVLTKPKMAFLMLTPDKKLWRGQAIWTNSTHEGEEYEKMNNIPLFRYNSYFGIHTVHYLNLVEYYGIEKLPMASIITSAIITKAIKPFFKPNIQENILKPWAEKLFSGLDTIKFLSYIGEDGFSKIIPIVQCQSVGSTRLLFSTLAYSNELSKVPNNADVAVLGFNMQMENCLVRGKYKKKNGAAYIDINWVYNSMPPKPEQIYPPIELKAVDVF